MECGIYSGINNKYFKWYRSIIKNAKDRNYKVAGEIHHITPKFDGGDNSKSNLVLLTYKEHFICHLLLTKFAVNKRGANYAFYRGMIMKMENGSRYNSRLFSFFRKLAYEKFCGKNNPFYGKHHSEQTKEKIRLLHKEAAKHPDYINPFYGRKHKEETLNKLSEAQRQNTSLPDYVNTFKDKKHKEETKEIMSRKAKERCCNGKWKPPFLGKKVTKEMKTKMLETKKVNGTEPIGGDNPRAIKVNYNGETYKTIKEFKMSYPGFTAGKIKQLENSGELQFVGDRKLGLLKNGNNPMAKRVVYEGIEYDSLISFREQTGISIFIQNKKIKNMELVFTTDKKEN